MVKAITLKYHGREVYRAEAEADKILSKQFGFNGYGRTTEGNFPVYLYPRSGLTIIKGIAETTGECSLQVKIYGYKHESFEAEQIARSLQTIGFEEQAGFLKIVGKGLVNYVLAPLSYAAEGFLSAVDRWTEQKVKLTELKPWLKNIDDAALAGLSADALELTTATLPAATPIARYVSAKDSDNALNHCLSKSALLLGRSLPKMELDGVNQRSAGPELAPFPDQPNLDQLITAKAVPVSPNYFQHRS